MIINMFGFLLSQVGWSGDTATGRRGLTSQGRRNAAHIGGRRAIKEGIIGFFNSPIF